MTDDIWEAVLRAWSSSSEGVVAQCWPLCRGHDQIWLDTELQFLLTIIHLSDGVAFYYLNSESCIWNFSKIINVCTKTRFLYHSWNFIVFVGYTPSGSSVERSETGTLWRRQIPYFTTTWKASNSPSFINLGPKPRLCDTPIAVPQRASLIYRRRTVSWRQVVS